MSDKTKIEWSDASWNPITGCDEVSPGCDNCLDPDTPVLMADMSWRPIGKIVAGDEVVSFTENPSLGQNRLYERATVVHAWKTVAEAVEITVGGRRIVASSDHRFLAHARPNWREAERLTLSTGLIDVQMPTWLPDVESKPYLAGYLAGAVSGDGTFRIDGSGKGDSKQSYLRVATLASDRPILDRLVKAFNLLGCTNIAIRPFDGGTSVAFGLTAERAPMAKVETRRMDNLTTFRDHCLPERDDLNWKAGYLAGFFDTDGCYSGKNLRFNQTKPNGLLDATHRYIADLGFKSVRGDSRSASGRSERLAGDLEEKIRFLATIQPALARKCADFYGRRFPGKTATKVDGIRRVGQRELVDIQTTSGTFIAAGIATHNCYAKTFAERWRGTPGHYFERGFDITFRPDKLDQPLRWTKPRKIFVNSMSDLFHKDIPDSFIHQVFAVMAATPQHTYQLLTKRHGRMRSLLRDECKCGAGHQPGVHFTSAIDWVSTPHSPLHIPGLPAGLYHQIQWPLPNVWIGVSVEDQQRADLRIPALRETPAAVRWLSCEPLLDAVDLAEHLVSAEPHPAFSGNAWDRGDLAWVVAGGESGNGARPMDADWARQLRDQCTTANVPYFFKQWGGRTPKTNGRELDGRTWDEYPADADSIKTPA